MISTGIEQRLAQLLDAFEKENDVIVTGLCLDIVDQVRDGGPKHVRKVRLELARKGNWV